MANIGMFFLKAVRLRTISLPEKNSRNLLEKLKEFQALFLDTCHAFYAFDFSEKLSFGLFELSFLQNN